MKFMKLGSKPDTFRNDGQNVRYVASELVTDITVVVGDVKFYMHKFPLLSKCANLPKLIASCNEETGDEVQVFDIPGGPIAFEICVKFCYGMAVTLNAYNVFAARSAAEYLGMDETIEKGNLIYKIDVFLNSCIFCSWKDSIIVLQTTKYVLPFPEESEVVGHCIDAIATKACIDVYEVDWSYTYNRRKALEKHRNDIRSRPAPKDWWVEDLCDLEIDLYKHVMMKIKTKGILSREVIGMALKAYSYRRLPGFSDGVIHSRDVAKYRSTVDTIVWLLPAGKRSVSCSFLLKLLKAAIIVDSGELALEQLVRRIGQQLEEASVKDLLIRAAEGEDVMYDVDVVRKILKEFLMQGWSSGFEEEEIEAREIQRPEILTDASKVMVAKLIDEYLAEIAKDPSLPPAKFVDLAEMVSGISRPDHDQLYRAIDMFLKEHPGLSKSERKRICKFINCKKPSVEACMHAVQNERLPLRTITQVLFFKQVRTAASSASSTPEDRNNPTRGSRGSSRLAATSQEENRDAPVTADKLKALKNLLKSKRIFSVYKSLVKQRKPLVPEIGNFSQLGP